MPDPAGHTSMNRRSFIKTSGALLGALSLAPVLSGGFARHVSAKEGIPNAMVIPSKDNPIRVQFNENALGMSPKAQEAAVKAIPMANRYPFNDVPKLRELVAAQHNVSEKNILFTPGSSDAIRACIAAYTTPETQFVAPDLTYADGVLYPAITSFA